jgi:hypothetical protein
MAAVLLIVGLIPLLICLALVESWVASILWGWFVVPTFGLPPLSLALALGLAVTVRLITGRYTVQSTKTDGQGAGATLFAGFLFPMLLLLVGYVAKSFM